MTRPRFPFTINVSLATLGALFVAHGALASDYLSPTPKTIVERGATTFTSTETRTVKRKIRGHVIHLPSGKKVIHVPLLIVHTDSRIIRIPAHNLPITRKLGSAVSVANPVLTVTVYLPSDPVTLTATETVTTTETTSIPPVTITTTVSVPLSPDPTTSDQGGLS